MIRVFLPGFCTPGVTQISISSKSHLNPLCTCAKRGLALNQGTLSLPAGISEIMKGMCTVTSANSQMPTSKIIKQNSAKKNKQKRNFITRQPKPKRASRNISTSVLLMVYMFASIGACALTPHRQCQL